MNQQETLHIETKTGGLNAAIKEVLTYQPDLIIEGGTNNRDTLLHIFREQYSGPYAGMDINPDIDYARSRFTVYGNCLRLDDVVTAIEGAFHEALPDLIVLFRLAHQHLS